MVIVRLRGGLGNQLFQYAAGKALALKHEVQLKLDLYTYTLHKYRSFELDNFCTNPEIAEQSEINNLIGRFKIQRLLNKFNHYSFSDKAFAQPHYHFVADFFDLPKDIYLSGYWQSEKYFEDIQDIIRAEIQPKSPIDDQNKSLIDQLNVENSVSVHIRMGDYKNLRKYKTFFGGLGSEYYKNAIELVQSKTENPRFYFFSDNIAWCQKEFSEVDNAYFVDQNTGEKSFMDMVLMSNCQHNIIANSTFSWWGAWLNSNLDKIVIAPKNWFQSKYNKKSVYKSQYYDTKDLLPEKWIKL
ncbi:MAG: alpha-1,2-fucosyltransferase [Cyclobacteriaceae bacterium]